MTYILDAFALLAFLNEELGKGWEKRNMSAGVNNRRWTTIGRSECK